MSLLDVLRGVMLDPAEQATYNADPGAYLERYGYDDVDPADLSEAFGLVADTLPPDQAQAAWEASTVTDDNSFGAVNADFDSDLAIGGEGVAPPETGADDPALDDPGADPTGPPVPALSFGEGDAGAGDLDDPSFEGAAGSGLDALDDTGLGADAGELHVDDAGLGADHIGAGLDDIGGLDDGGLDDIGALDDGGLDDGPDDLDIGSF